MESQNQSCVLEVNNLSVDFGVGNQRVQAVKNISFKLYQGETLATFNLNI